MSRFVPRRKSARRFLIVIAAAGSILASWESDRRRAQDGPGLQPFATPSPTPRQRVRRAQPSERTTPRSPTPDDPPTARAVPFDSPAPSATPRRPTPDAVPVAPLSAPRRRRTRRADEVVPDDHDDATPSPSRSESTPRPLPPRIRPHGSTVHTRHGGHGNAAASPRRPAVTANDDDSTDIRIAPHAPGAPAVSAEDQQFDLAGDFFLRKEYTQAASPTTSVTWASTPTASSGRLLTGGWGKVTGC